MSEQTKEQVYDEQIAPLMDQIIKICEQHKMAMIASFDIEQDGNGLRCSTSMIGGKYPSPKGYVDAAVAIYGRERAMAIAFMNMAPGGTA